MSLVPFEQLPEDARIWIFAATEPLTDAEAQPLLEHVRAFVEQWTAHGRRVTGGYEWRHNRFLVVAADERASQVSGCSIDSLFHTLQQLEQTRGITLTDRAPVWYRDANGAVHAASRPEFRQLVRSGAVNGNTRVFDNTASTVGDLRHGHWELPLRDSWHAGAFGVGAAA